VYYVYITFGFKTDSWVTSV